MNSVVLIRFGALAAVAGGTLRIGAAFVPYKDGLVWQEILYSVIDVSFLFGLIATYLFSAERIGRLGLVSFLVATTGAASIIGPDAVKWGISFYQMGALVLIVGVLGLSACLLRANILVVGAIFWMFGSTTGVAVGLTGNVTGFWIAGILLGAGFIAAGLGVYTNTPNEHFTNSRWRRMPPAAG